MAKVSTSEFEKALKALEAALKEPKTDISRDAAIQRFEYCVELAWKTSKKTMGTATAAPRSIIREMAAQGLIQEPSPWFDFLDARNLSSHTYKEEVAEKVFEAARAFLPMAKALLKQLAEQLTEQSK